MKLLSDQFKRDQQTKSLVLGASLWIILLKIVCNWSLVSEYTRSEKVTGDWT